MTDDIMAEAERSRFEEYIHYLRASGRKETTIDSYRQAHRAFCVHVAAREVRLVDMVSCTGLDVRALKSAMLTAGKAAATINHRLVVMKAYATWCHRRGYITAQQADTIGAVPEIPITRLAPRCMEPEALRRFLRTVELQGTVRDRALIHLLLCGLRESEVAGLRVGDVHMNAHRGHVHIAGEHVKRSAMRDVPLYRATRLLLRQHLEENRPENFVFVGERGPLTTSGVYKSVTKYGARAGVHVYPHQLRHEFSRVYLAANNNDLVGLQALLGHSSVETTARFYSRKRLEDLQDAVERIPL